MAKELTLDKAITLLREAVKEKGTDYKYEIPTWESETGELITADQCMYKDFDGKPSCIVGHVIHKLLPEKWEELDFIEGTLAQDLVRELQDEGYLTVVDEEVLDFLGYAQGEQDRGRTWGVAYHEALEVVGRDVEL